MLDASFGIGNPNSDEYNGDHPYPGRTWVISAVMKYWQPLACIQYVAPPTQGDAVTMDELDRFTRTVADRQSGARDD